MNPASTVSPAGPVAAIDCGTNSIRLLIAEPDGATLRELHREMRIVRLGQGVDATGAFAPEAIERTRAALSDYAGLLTAHRVQRVRMVATSAARDVSNRDAFFAMTARELGAAVPGAVAEVISGTEEAALSFAGAVADLDVATHGTAPLIVVDLGGGSTEVVLGKRRDSGADVLASYSADIGCVRLTERCLRSDPPTADQIAAARRVVDDQIAAALAAVPVERAHTWVGVAGTMTTLSALAHGLTHYDPAAIHLSRIDHHRLQQTCDRLITMTRAERAALGPMHPGRVDVIGGGAIVAAQLAATLQQRAGLTELIVSEHDILDGIALSVIG